MKKRAKPKKRAPKRGALDDVQFLMAVDRADLLLALNRIERLEMMIELVAKGLELIGTRQFMAPVTHFGKPDESKN